MPPDDRSPWMLPLRKPVIDGKGHLRLGWWAQNEFLKGPEIDLKTRVIAFESGQGREIAWIEPLFDLHRGVVLECRLRAEGLTAGASTGLIFSEHRDVVMETRIGIGVAGERKALIGRCDRTHGFMPEDVTGSGCATVTGIDNGKGHLLRVLARYEMFEIYIDDLLFQTYTYRPDSGRIGVVAINARAEYRDIRAWRMS